MADTVLVGDETNQFELVAERRRAPSAPPG
jgi:hypothetical protein